MLYDKCQRCGRALKSETSQTLGFGPSCYRKHLQEKQIPCKKLFVLQDVKK